MNKKLIKEHFLYFGWVYLIIAAISIALSLWILPAKTRLKSYEKVGIFLAIQTYNGEVLKNKILENDDSLLDVDVYAENPTNYYFASYLQSAGKQSSDFFITSKTAINEEYIQSYCAFLSTEKWRGEFVHAEELLTINERNYGFKLDKNNPVLQSALSFEDEVEEDFYLLINRNSKNFGDFYCKEENTKESDHALKAIHTLID